MSGWFFAVFLLLSGGYLLFFGIKGKGEIYKNPNVKAGCEQKYRGIARVYLLILGAFTIFMGTMELLGYFSVIVYGRRIQVVLLCISILIIALMLITLRKFTHKGPCDKTPGGELETNTESDINVQKRQ